MDFGLEEDSELYFVCENILINEGSLKGERGRIFSLSGDKEAWEHYEMLKLSFFSRRILAV